jgi:aryl-alcohol dehydrogenase-like predicted oxidoreductase
MADDDPDRHSLTLETLSRDHETVVAWIDTIHYAIQTAGITLLDTAPWYGHGVSETVVGWALQNLQLSVEQRRKLYVQTKVGRYAADHCKQFDFSYETTVKSVKRSLERLQIEYIDCVQLHDPEFAFNLPHVMAALEGLRFAKRQGWCRSIGLTGYPLAVQHQIMEASWKRFGGNIFDQVLTYSHFNLHDTSLFDNPISSTAEQSFYEYCMERKTPVLAAAPLSMGLLTKQGPPAWHPASDELKLACRQAEQVCESYKVDIASLALLFALADPRIPCTILGMKSIEQVQAAQTVANRFQTIDGGGDPLPSHGQVLEQVSTQSERECLEAVCDPETGPFAKIQQKGGSYKWDGVQEAITFWSHVNEQATFERWQVQDS